MLQIHSHPDLIEYGEMTGEGIMELVYEMLLQNDERVAIMQALAGGGGTGMEAGAAAAAGLLPMG